MYEKTDGVYKDFSSEEKRLFDISIILLSKNTMIIETI